MFLVTRSPCRFYQFFENKLADVAQTIDICIPWESVDEHLIASLAVFVPPSS
jgi:hypothetical protein